jgi:proteasome lid subunit RPN8/RPN11
VLGACLLAALETQARARYPEEACGILLGSDRGAERFVLGAHGARNVAAEPRCAFELDPGAIVRVHSGARVPGRGLLGFWHSHPDAPARLSRADRSTAWEGCSYLVLALGARGIVRCKSFRCLGGEFLEEELSLAPEGARAGETERPSAFKNGMPGAEG